MGKKIVWGAFIFLGAILLLVFSALGPIDYTPLEQLEEVTRTLHKFDTVKFKSDAGSGILNAGWSSVNITPPYPTDMAGYGPRGPYIGVRDSLYSRAAVLSNGSKEVAVISLDLILFPRFVKDQLYDTLAQYGFSKNDIFLTATHTHNGFGNWEKSTGGQFIFGDFRPDIVKYLVDNIVFGVLWAKKNQMPAVIGFQKIEAAELVINRISGKDGITDPNLRVIRIKKQDGMQGLIVSYAAHAVNLDADIWEISRDYPGILADELEKNPKIDFAMFCAGTVASHNLRSDIQKGPDRITDAGMRLSKKILSADSIMYNNNARLGGLDIEIELPPSQMRLTPNIRIRDWLFSALLGPLEANVKALEIGDILMIGMPSDFSGELAIINRLDEFAEARNKDLFITSFNGNYIGYITEDGHYTACNHDEVKSMNWVGPYKGEYFTEIIKKVIKASASQ